MANPFPSGDPADDPLALFGPETDTDAKAPASKTAPAPTQSAAKQPQPAARPTQSAAKPAQPVAREAEPSLYPSPSVLKKLAAEVPEPTAAPRDLGVEIVGPPPPARAISFDRISSVKGLGFVEAVALIQSTCEALQAEGESAGVPDSHGLFLTADGEVILNGPPTGEPPARELAMMIHQMVAPNLMPPAGRLFVGRWINNDAPGLTEFASELAYFARPNSRELLGALHNRCESARPPAQVHRLEPKRTAPQKPAIEAQAAADQLPALKAWMKFHKPEVLVAAVVLIAMTTTAIATFMSNPKAAEAKPPVEEVAVPEDAAGEAADPAGAVASRTVASTAPSAKPVASQVTSTKRAAPRTRVANPPLVRGRSAGNQPGTTAIASQNAAAGLTPPPVPPLLPGRAVSDLKIYSSSDGGVQPPRLRSAEIPELLIAGFEKRQNQIELIISERGEVQQAHMIGPPQRMPDVMLLSRAKELLFDPAIRNGVPVRYKLILSWNVTP